MKSINLYNDEFDIHGYQWKLYCDVQKEGLYNMLSPQAREATCLEKSTYLKIIRNYDKLKQFFDGGL